MKFKAACLVARFFGEDRRGYTKVIVAPGSPELEKLPRLTLQRGNSETADAPKYPLIMSITRVTIHFPSKVRWTYGPKITHRTTHPELVALADGLEAGEFADPFLDALLEMLKGKKVERTQAQAKFLELVCRAFDLASPISE